jgi:hypothetical protein
VSGAHDNRRDRERLARLAAGSAEALAELYDGHAASLLRHAAALTRCRADAEDLVQTVFLKVATVGAELLGVRQPKNYLHRMIHTTWIDGQRRLVTERRIVEGAVFDIDGSLDAHRAGGENVIDIARALAYAAGSAAGGTRVARRRRIFIPRNWAPDGCLALHGGGSIPAGPDAPAANATSGLWKRMMTQVELETLIRQVPWPIPSRDLRMRVLAAGQTTSRAVLWSDRIWFSRGWRSAGATAAIVAIAVGFWNSTEQRTTLVPPVAQASAEAVADVGPNSGRSW